MIAFSWAFAHAVNARTTEWVSPWDVQLIEPSEDCAQLCGNWSALYLSDTGCKGDDMVARNSLRFCPDKDEVEAWTVDNEEIYVTMYHRADELLTPELEIFERLAFERMMKLSVHPWQKFQYKDVHALVERRRKQGSSKFFRCIGNRPRIGTKNRHYGGARPLKVGLELQEVDGETIISRFEAKYQVGNINGGDENDLAKSKKKKLPACTTVVFGKTDSKYVNAINFLTQGRETRLMGEDINESIIIVAPRGKCLGDMRMRSDEFVNRLCFKFNADE